LTVCQATRYYKKKIMKNKIAIRQFSKKIILSIITLSLFFFVFSLTFISPALAQGVGEEGDNDHDGIIEKGPADFDTDNDGKINREFFGYKDKYVDFTKMKWEEFDDDRDGDGIPDDDDKYDPPIRVGGLIFIDASFDHDNDGFTDETDADDDNDGILDDDEKSGRRLDFDNDGIPDKTDTDKDGDKFPEADGKNYVDANGDGKDDNTGVDLDPSPRDKDNDGVQDGWERILERDPNNPDDRNKDTDRDGFSDLLEIQRGTDPVNPESKPTGTPPSPTPPKKSFLGNIFNQLGDVVGKLLGKQGNQDEKPSDADKALLEAEQEAEKLEEFEKQKERERIAREADEALREAEEVAERQELSERAEKALIEAEQEAEKLEDSEKKKDIINKIGNIVGQSLGLQKLLTLTEITKNLYWDRKTDTYYEFKDNRLRELPTPRTVTFDVGGTEKVVSKKVGILDRLGDLAGRLLGKKSVQEEELSPADKALLEAEQEAETLEAKEKKAAEAQKEANKAEEKAKEAAKAQKEAEQKREEAEFLIDRAQEKINALEKNLQAIKNRIIIGDSNEPAVIEAFSDKERDLKRAEEDLEKARAEWGKAESNLGKANDDAGKAREKTEQEKREADKAKETAEQARKEAEQARKEAEQARKEAEQELRKLLEKLGYPRGGGDLDPDEFKPPEKEVEQLKIAVQSQEEWNKQIKKFEEGLAAEKEKNAKLQKEIEKLIEKIKELNDKLIEELKKGDNGSVAGSAGSAVGACSAVITGRDLTKDTFDLKVIGGIARIRSLVRDTLVSEREFPFTPGTTFIMGIPYLPNTDKTLVDVKKSDGSFCDNIAPGGVISIPSAANQVGGGSTGGPVPAPLTITTASLSNPTIDIAYSQTLAATGGTTSYSWSVVSGSLPAGLSLNTSTGAITGTPTAAGTSNFTVRVTDSASVALTNDKAFSVVIADR